MVRDPIITGMRRFFVFILFCSSFIACLSLTSADSMKIEEFQDVQPVKIRFFDLEILQPSTGIQFYRDGIVFPGRTNIYSKMVSSHVSFGTTYTYYAVFGDSSLQDPVVFTPGFKFSYPCDALSFNKSYDRMYLTRKDKTGKYAKIYVSDYTVGKDGRGSWSDPSQPLDFCTGNFIYTHPALSDNGEIMIFASDMEGSLGGLDLYISRKKDDTWSVPRNMGEIINTRSNDNYPFLDNSDNLYFSSDGHPGYGGYDIFVCRFNGKSWEEPVNLTKLVNTPDDEVAFKLNRLNAKTGFFSSIDNVNKRYAQLYKIDFENNTLHGNLKNLSDAILDRAFNDTTFTYQKLLIAASHDIERAEEEARRAEAERAAKTKEVTGIAESEKLAEAARTEEAKRIAGEAKAAEAKRIADEAKAAEARRTADVARAAEARRIADEAKAAETKRIADEAKAAEAKRLAEAAKAEEKAKTESAAKQPAAKTVTIKPVTEVPENLKNIVVYRVQFYSGSAPDKIKEVVAGGKSYSPYVYFYLNEYRYTAGEFTTLEPAKQLQSELRKAGYPQAFVAAFKNNVRSLDLSLFR